MQVFESSPGLVRVRPDFESKADVWGMTPFLSDNLVVVSSRQKVMMLALSGSILGLIIINKYC